MHIGRTEIVVMAVAVVIMIVLGVRMRVMLVMMIGAAHEQQRAHDVDEEAQDRNQRGIAEIDAHRRSEEHTSELQSPMRNSYDVFCLKNTHTDKSIKLRT